MRIAFISVFVFLVSVVISGQSQNRPDVLLSKAGRVNMADTTNTGYLYTAAPHGYIAFATAFRWNRTGPTGGYWNENIVDDYTFRPFFANILSYRLEIYSRTGYLIYVSSDLYKGWDGYLKNGAPATQGVYIWKASGKYVDGGLFNEMGDVTFIY